MKVETCQICGEPEPEFTVGQSNVGICLGCVTNRLPCELVHNIIHSMCCWHGGIEVYAEILGQFTEAFTQALPAALLDAKVDFDFEDVCEGEVTDDDEEMDDGPLDQKERKKA